MTRAPGGTAQGQAVLTPGASLVDPVRRSSCVASERVSSVGGQKKSVKANRAFDSSSPATDSLGSPLRSYTCV